MGRTESGLKVVEPEPVNDERTPLLEHADGHANAPQDSNEALEAIAEQERREHDAGATPVADEPTTGRLVATMSALWCGTFFAALGQ